MAVSNEKLPERIIKTSFWTSLGVFYNLIKLCVNIKLWLGIYSSKSLSYSVLSLCISSDVYGYIPTDISAYIQNKWFYFHFYIPSFDDKFYIF